MAEENGATSGVATLTKKDFTSDQEPRWCPGCGDYAILAAVQGFMPELGIEPHNTVFISGIGCTGRFTYYMDTYGFHGIHGRAPAIATGVATANPALQVWVVTGDGDALSIGGNHLIHALRRNVNIKILMFNNQIYGLTKGQYSPTSDARTVDNDRKHLTDVLRQAAEHPGSAFVEIYQNCNVFNDGAFDLIRDKQQGVHNQIRLVDGEPIVFDEGTRCVRVGENGRLEIAAVADSDPSSIVTHEVHSRPSLAFALAHLSQGPTEPTCIGVFHEEDRSTYGEAVRSQLERAVERLGPGDLKTLLHGGDTWTVG